MSKKLVKRHDPLTQKFLYDPTIAKEFVKTYLVPECFNKCDIDSLSIESESYIEDDLKAYFSDYY